MRRSAIALAALFPMLGLLAACQTAKPVPPPVVEAPKPKAPLNDIVLSPADEAAMRSAMDRLAAAPLNTTVAWTGNGSGISGSLKVLRDGFDDKNRSCREFHSLMVQEDLYKHATGFLCRQPDGGWTVADQRLYPVYRHRS